MDTESIEVVIQNCNSLDSATVRLRLGALNLKYGPNGTGKSTLSRAMWMAVNNDDRIGDLLPFKHRGKSDDIEPKVDGVGRFTRAEIFDDAYVHNIAFKEDEAVKGSYEIIVGGEAYSRGERELAAYASTLRDVTSREETRTLVDGLREILTLFSLTRQGALSQKSKGARALSAVQAASSYATQHPETLPFLVQDDTSAWLKWHVTGKGFWSEGKPCPFCLKVGPEDSVAWTLSDGLDGAGLKNRQEILDKLQKISPFMAPSAAGELRSILEGKPLSPVTAEYYLASGFAQEADRLLRALTIAEEISFDVLKKESDVAAYITSINVSVGKFEFFDTGTVRSIIDDVDEAVAALKKVAKQILGGVNRQRQQLKSVIEKNEREINSFLKSAGYKYSTAVDSETLKMHVRHVDFEENLHDAAIYLSFGEKNAFALVLFMYQALSRGADLVLLDDPVSSFDREKRFAILHRLFSKEGGFRGLTVVMLTHDLEPAVDMIRVGTSRLFKGVAPFVTALGAVGGSLTEHEIGYSDICTFSEICRKVINDRDSSTLMRAVHLRKLLEIEGCFDLEYNLVSSLLHGRSNPNRKTNRTYVDLSPDEICTAELRIKQRVADFVYSEWLKEVSGWGALKEQFDQAVTKYEKLLVFRVMQDQFGDNLSDDLDDVLLKFINEQFHIENGFVMQLDPRRFDQTPDHALEACAQIVRELETSFLVGGDSAASGGETACAGTTRA